MVVERWRIGFDVLMGTDCIHNFLMHCLRLYEFAVSNCACRTREESHMSKDVMHSCWCHLGGDEVRTGVSNKLVSSYFAVVIIIIIRC